MNCIIDDFFALNYTKCDKDNLVHIVTEVDPSQCKQLIDVVSPSARRVITSQFIASFLLEKFGFKCLAAQFNKKKRVSLRDNPDVSYCLTLIDSKHKLGSCGVLIEGHFGTALYAGKFLLCKNFLSSPIIGGFRRQVRVLNTLYLCSDYYERNLKILSWDENIEKICQLLQENKGRKVFITAEKNMEPVICELAVRFDEKFYIHPSMNRAICELGCGKYFTNNINHARVLIVDFFGRIKENTNGFLKIILRKHSENTTIFSRDQYMKSNDLYIFNFYSYNTHRDCCLIINKLTPERVVLLQDTTIPSELIPIDIPCISKLNLNIPSSIEVHDNSKDINEPLINQSLLRIRTLSELNTLPPEQLGLTQEDVMTQDNHTFNSLKQDVEPETSGNSVKNPEREHPSTQPKTKSSYSSINHFLNQDEKAETSAYSVMKPEKVYHRTQPRNKKSSSSVINPSIQTKNRRPSTSLINSINQNETAETSSYSVMNPGRVYHRTQSKNRRPSSSVIDSLNEEDGAETSIYSVIKPKRAYHRTQPKNQRSSPAVINSRNQHDEAEASTSSSINHVNIPFNIKSEVDEVGSHQYPYPKLRRSERILTLNTHLRRSERLISKIKRENEYHNETPNIEINPEPIVKRRKRSASKVERVKTEVEDDEPLTVPIRRSLRLSLKIKCENDCTDQKPKLNNDPIPKVIRSKKLISKPKSIKTEIDEFHNRPSTSTSKQQEMCQDYLKENRNSSVKCKNGKSQICPEIKECSVRINRNDMDRYYYCPMEQAYFEGFLGFSEEEDLMLLRAENYP